MKQVIQKLNKIDKVFVLILIAALLSMLRNIILPLAGDEITYFKLSENILQGKYYLNENPSTIAPVIPLVNSLFSISSFPLLGFVLNKLFYIVLVFIGLRFFYRLLLILNIEKIVAHAIVVFTLVNPTSIAWFSRLYPESILFVSFWGFIYYSVLKTSKRNLFKLLLCFSLLVFTRYVYAVLGIILLIKYYEYLKTNFRVYLTPVLIYSIIFLIPFIIWAKYIYNIEQSDLSEISYFERFRIENPWLYNIKCGLGLEKHYEVSRINGIPAFVSLFIPITGFRSFILSIVLLLIFIYGYFVKPKGYHLKRIFLPILLIMIGFIIAGTGFSRYWLVLLPGYYFGYYLAFKSFGFKDLLFVNMVKVVSVIYIINELRINVLVLNQYI